MSPRYVQVGLDHFDDDRRIGCADPAVIAAEVVLMATTKALESDGRLTRLQVRKALAGCEFIDDPARVVDGLVAAGLAVRDDDGAIELPGWQAWMKPKAELEAYREAQREHGRRGGKRSGQSRREKSTKQDTPEPPKADPSGHAKGEPSDTGRVTPRVGGSQPTRTEVEPNQPTPRAAITVQRVIARYVAHRQQQGGLTNPEGFRRTVEREWSTWIARYIDEHPSANIDQIGDALHAAKTRAGAA